MSAGFRWCHPGLLLSPGSETPPRVLQESERLGKTMARPQQEATCALGEHKSSQSCHQTSQSPARIPGGEIRAGKHILFLLLEVPSLVEMNWPSVPSQPRSGKP